MATGPTMGMARVTGWDRPRPVRIYDTKVQIVVTWAGDLPGIDREHLVTDRRNAPDYLIEQGEGGHRWLTFSFPGGQRPVGVYGWLKDALGVPDVVPMPMTP